MWTYYPDLLSVPVPRYTSFPTAAEFTASIGNAEYVSALRQCTGEVSLYVHIPFCEKICWYCGCNTSVANKRTRVSNYLEALHREISMVANALPQSTPITRIAFGGGSPNGISPIDFVRLVNALVLQFEAVNPVVSIELDPRTFGPEWRHVLTGIGIDRASLGVQTFEPVLQEAIGRVQPVEMIEQSVGLLREAGVTSLNFDLMYGLPGQTLDHLESTLQRTVAMGADRIALFGYAHVPHLIARQRRIDGSNLPDAQMRFAMASFGYAYLVEQGYVAVGFDHFAKPADPLAQASVSDTLKRNFQGFTEDQAPVLLGLGASAISSFPNLLVQNEKNTGQYRKVIGQGTLAASRGITRNVEDQERGQIIEAFLCQGRASVVPRLQDEAAALLRPYLLAELCRFEGGTLELLPEGLPYARSIAACFDPYRKESLRRFSSAI